MGGGGRGGWEEGKPYRLLKVQENLASCNKEPNEVAVAAENLFNRVVSGTVCVGGGRGGEDSAKLPTKGPSKFSNKEPVEVAVPAENPFDRSLSNIGKVYVCVWVGGCVWGVGRGNQTTYQRTEHIRHW